MVKKKMHIITITNQKRFVQYKFGEERIQKNAETSWWPITME